MGGLVVGIGNKSQLSPAIAGAGAWPELGNTSYPQVPSRFLQYGCWARNKLSRAGGWLGGARNWK